MKGVSIDKAEEGISPSFSLDLDVPFGDGSAPAKLLEDLAAAFPEFSEPDLRLSYGDAVNLLLCADLAGQVMDQFPYEGEIVNDLKSALACAFFNDAVAMAEIEKWSDDLDFDLTRHKDALMGITKEIYAMQGEQNG